MDHAAVAERLAVFQLLARINHELLVWRPTLSLTELLLDPQDCVRKEYIEDVGFTQVTFHKDLRRFLLVHAGVGGVVTELHD